MTSLDIPQDTYWNIATICLIKKWTVSEVVDENMREWVKDIVVGDPALSRLYWDDKGLLQEMKP
jgi:hypothetical protein